MKEISEQLHTNINFISVELLQRTIADLEAQVMNKETLYDLRRYVSDCFNHREGAGADSGYMRLSKLMKEEYDLDNNDIDEVVDDIEKLVAQHIMENSPKFTDDDDD